MSARSARARWSPSLALACALAACSSGSPLDITIDTGPLHGVDSGTGNIRAFLGIPYAAPPVGDLRWRAPQPVAKWNGTLQATHVGQQCPQLLSYAGPSYDEDCLYLNVWSPTGAHDLPVMVWLHGGAFIFGSGGDKWYQGDLLAQQDVVVVTLNYRLGALGFMANPASDNEDPAFPTSGNYGLEDQRFALEWVQRNIAAFGGDPTRVTLFGESAGGFSTCVHYLSDRTQGLFSAALAESGLCGASVLSPGHADAESLALDLGMQLGCPGSTASSLACLRAVDAQTIVQATALPPLMTQMPGGPLYQPTVLGNQLPNVDGYVIEQPLRAEFAAGQFQKRPFLVGTNRDEGTLFQSSVYALPVTDETDYEAALSMRFLSENVAAIVAQYPIASYASANAALAAVSGDAFFVCPARAAARGAVAAGASVFRYSFEQPLANPFEQGLGVFHSSEIPFVFGHDDYPLGMLGSAVPLSTAMQQYWTTFAKTYAPGDGGSAGEGGVAWPAYNATMDPYQLLVAPTISASAGLKTDLCDFWDQLAATGVD
jgi:para-nitrobenzyl esterase